MNNNVENKPKIKGATINILMAKLANEWLEIGARIKNPKPLFGKIWYEGEVAILFSNTGVGKSILAVQLADTISKGLPLLGIKSDAYKVLYFDFELSTKAFQLRYSINNTDHYLFSDNFIRIEIDRDENLESRTDSMEELIIKSIKEQVSLHDPKVIIIDNITFLSATFEKSKEALELMKLILDLSRKKELSILLIAHTPKRDVYRPIELEDLAGSKALSNFVDVCFCIGKSIQGSNIRYIKELKNRNRPMTYEEKNVVDCFIEKDDSFLKFNVTGNSNEKNHLLNSDLEGKDDKVEKTKSYKASGKSNVEIAKILKVSEKTIRRWLKT